jgi:hypothetical protein
MRFWPNDIFRIPFGQDGYIDLAVSREFVLSLKFKGSGESSPITTHHYLSEEDAKSLWVEMEKLWVKK